MRGGNYLSRSAIALYEPPKPQGLREFRDSSANISNEDDGIFYQALFAQLDKDFVAAKMLYIELLKKSYLRTNSVILHNLELCDKELE